MNTRKAVSEAAWSVQKKGMNEPNRLLTIQAKDMINEATTILLDVLRDDDDDELRLIFRKIEEQRIALEAWIEVES